MGIEAKTTVPPASGEEEKREVNKSENPHLPNPRQLVKIQYYQAEKMQREGWAKKIEEQLTKIQRDTFKTPADTTLRTDYRTVDFAFGLTPGFYMKDGEPVACGDLKIIDRSRGNQQLPVIRITDFNKGEWADHVRYRTKDYFMNLWQKATQERDVNNAEAALNKVVNE